MAKPINTFEQIGPDLETSWGSALTENKLDTEFALASEGLPPDRPPTGDGLH